MIPKKKMKKIFIGSTYTRFMHEMRNTLRAHQRSQMLVWLIRIHIHIIIQTIRHNFEQLIENAKCVENINKQHSTEHTVYINETDSRIPIMLVHFTGFDYRCKQGGARVT